MFKCNYINNYFYVLHFFLFLQVHISNKNLNSIIFLLDLFLTTSPTSDTFQFEIWENVVRNLIFEAFLTDGFQ